MELTNIRPGAILAIRHSTYTHFGIVSDKRDAQGKPMIIDNSSAAGAVQERSWHCAVGARNFTLASFQPRLSANEVLRRAREKIGQKRYCLFRSNCEAFVREVAGLERTSNQVTACVVTVPIAARFAYEATDGNWFWTLASATAALAMTTYAVSK